MSRAGQREISQWWLQWMCKDLGDCVTLVDVHVSVALEQRNVAVILRIVMFQYSLLHEPTTPQSRRRASHHCSLDTPSMMQYLHCLLHCPHAYPCPPGVRSVEVYHDSLGSWFPHNSTAFFTSPSPSLSPFTSL